MERWLDIVIFIALAAVAITLAFGIYSLYRGGDFSRSYSNKLMRLRGMACGSRLQPADMAAQTIGS